MIYNYFTIYKNPLKNDSWTIKSTNNEEIEDWVKYLTKDVKWDDFWEPIINKIRLEIDLLDNTIIDYDTFKQILIWNITGNYHNNILSSLRQQTQLKKTFDHVTPLLKQYH